MTLDEMCLMAARYSDRYDEMEKNDEGEYEDDALHYFNIFRDAINEAYREVSRKQASPDCYAHAIVDSDGQVDLTIIEPAVYSMKDVLNEDRTAAIGFTFDTKYVLNVSASPNTRVVLYYHYLPEDLTDLEDSPIFTDSQVDPMVYVCLAVARIWQSEKKFEYASHWLSQYYSMLRDIRSDLRDRVNRRIPRRRFR